MEYLVTLKFADFYGASATAFSAAVNGETTQSLNWIDVAANAGGERSPWDVTLPVSADNGLISIVLSQIQSDPYINAIQIVPAGYLEVYPNNSVLDGQQVVQSSAYSGGVATTAVTWSLTPRIGTISSSGLYTAPASITAPTNVTVTATSVDDPSKSASTTVALYSSAATAFSPIRVNAGGPGYTDPQGLCWAASSGFSYVPPQTKVPASFSFTPQTASNTPVIYQTGLSSSSAFQYQATVPNGQYLVTLKFADYWYDDGFDLSINGITVLPDTSVAGNVSMYNPWDATYPVNVTNGAIIIVVSPLSRCDCIAIVNAIQIVAVDSVGVSPSVVDLASSQTQQFTATLGNPSSPGVTWTLTPAGVGSITTAGLYTAPASLPAAQTVVVTATDQAAPNLSQTATVNLYPAGSLLISPPSVNVQAGSTQQFATALSDGSSTTISWLTRLSHLGTYSAAKPCVFSGGSANVCTTV
jgi:hypothetical protein